MIDDVPAVITLGWLLSLAGAVGAAATLAVDRLTRRGARVAPYALLPAFALLGLIFLQQARAAADPTFNLIPRTGAPTPFQIAALLLGQLVTAAQPVLVYVALPLCWLLLLRETLRADA